MKQVTAMQDWLSYALAEYDDEKIAASNKRAAAALNVRLDARVSSFLRRSESLEELGMRLDTVDEAVQEIVNEVATEYGANPAQLYEAAAAKIAFDFGQPFQQGQEGTPPSGYSEVQCAKCGAKAQLGVPCPMCQHINQAGEAPGGAGGGMGGLRERIVGSVKVAEIPYDMERGMNPEMTEQYYGEDEPAANEISCPNCGGPGEELGTLGSRHHYRCRNCGSDFNEQMHDEIPGEEGLYSGDPNDPADGRAPAYRDAKTSAGPEMPDGAHYDYKRVNPASPIGGDKSVAQAEGPNYEYNKDADAALGQSEDNPREMQDISQYVEDRRTINDQDDKDIIKREVKHINPQDAIGSEQKGVGGTFPRGDQAKAVAAVTSKFHILD